MLIFLRFLYSLKGSTWSPRPHLPIQLHLHLEPNRLAGNICFIRPGVQSRHSNWTALSSPVRNISWRPLCMDSCVKHRLGNPHMNIFHLLKSLPSIPRERLLATFVDEQTQAEGEGQLAQSNTGFYILCPQKVYETHPKPFPKEDRNNCKLTQQYWNKEDSQWNLWDWIQNKKVESFVWKTGLKL